MFSLIRDITSRTNPLIVKTASLNNSKGRRENGLYLFDGYKLLCEAVEADIQIEYIISTDDAYRKYEAYIKKADTKTYIVPETCFEKISSEKAPQGVIGVSKLNSIPNINSCDFAKNSIVLSDIQDAGNLGTIIRTAKAITNANVILCGDCADVFGNKCIRSSMGAVFKQDIYRCDDIAMLAKKAKDYGKHLYAAALKDGAKDISKCDMKNCITLLGNEGHGLSDEKISYCEPMIIPMLGMESLNVSAAATIVLWEMSR